MKVIPETHLAY